MSEILENPEKSFLQALLDRDETDRLEFKRMYKKPGELLASVVALANAKWGYLVLWVEDFSKSKGLERLTGINEGIDNYSEFLTLVARQIQPQLIEIYKDEIPIINTKGQKDRVVLIRILPSTEIYSTSSWDTFLRKDKTNRKIGGQEIMRLKYEKGSLKYEDENSVISDLTELDDVMFSQFKESIWAKWDDWQILKDNALATQLGEKHKRVLKNSWVLLFWKNPSVLLRWRCGIKVSHYYGNQIDYTGEPNLRMKPFTIEWPLRTQIEQCVDFFKNLVRSSPPVLQENWGFESTLLIPFWVFQEAITNAVIHRNYAISNDIQVRIFDNRIEIESPGAYPGHITPSNIKEERFHRNPMISRALNRLSSAPNLDNGEGVDRMFQVMKEHNLNDPVYSSITTKPTSVMVTLYNSYKVEYWDIIKSYLLENWSISNQQTRQITGIRDTHKASRLLKKFVDNGFLKAKGEKKQTIYRLEEDYPGFKDLDCSRKAKMQIKEN